MKKKILVRGPLLTASGYGEHTRFIVRGLSSFFREIELFVIPTEWGQTNWLAVDNKERVYFDSLIKKTQGFLQNKGTFDCCLQVTIPNEWDNQAAPKNIGITAGIETDKVSPVWLEKAHLVDKIITISRHSKKGFEDTRYQVKDREGKDFILQCPLPVDVLHYPVKDIEPDKNFQLDLKYDFNFLVVAQWSPRKNLENTIQWFVEEFHDQEVGLIVKTNIAKNCLIDRRVTEKRLKNLLEKFKERKCQIKLLHGYLSEEEMTALYRLSEVKAMVTLTHGEGFGLPLFEAAYNGLPIIAPAWSGHCDFLYAPQKNKKGKERLKSMFSKVDFKIGPVQKNAIWQGVIEEYSNWCYPEQGSFKMKLREMRKDYGRHKNTATKLEKWIKENFKAEDLCLEMKNLVFSVFEDKKTPDNEPEVLIL